MRAPPGIHVAQLSAGTGLPIVFGHALGLDHTMWADSAANLAGRHPSLAYDLRGHGGSAGYAGPASLQVLVDDAARLIEAWGVGPVVFVGLSMGGMVAQDLAIQRPDLVRALVLAHTTAAYPPAGRAAWAQRIAAVQAGGMAAVADGVVSRYLTLDFIQRRPVAAQQLRQLILQADPSAYVANCQAIAEVNWLDDLHRIACPTLVLAGAHDAGATPTMAQAIQQRIAGASLEVFAHASHLSPLEQADDFQRALDQFLSSLPTSP